MNATHILVSSTGFIAGLLAGWLWILVAKRIGRDDFWQSLQRVMQLLISDDSQDQFFREYVRLLPLFGKYLLIKLATAMIVLSPIALCYVLLRPAVQSWEVSFAVAVSLGSAASLFGAWVLRN